MLKFPELLSPAGTLKSMRYAFAYGADAIYAGQPRYSLRVRNNEFSQANLELGIQEAHAQGKKFLVASNIAPHNTKVKTYINDLEPVIEAKPDALIMSDPGLIMMVKERWPDTEIHLSVQSNVVNFAGVKFWKAQGVSRIILSRELQIKEVQEIRETCPDVELEVFVHGALCMAYSGRCLLSGYINHRDPNQGTCTNACRWKYEAKEATIDEWGNVKPQVGEGAPTQKAYVVTESGKPEKSMTVMEDEHGTYMYNSKDLRAIHHVEKFVKMGIDCLKIEGRTKSHFYVARTAQLYRRAIDDAVAGRSFNIELMDALEGLSNRGYTEGLFRRHVHDEYQNYEHGSSKTNKQKFVGEFVDYNSQTEMVTVLVKNRFEVGDRLEILLPEGNRSVLLEHLENEEGQKIDVALGSPYVVRFPLPGVKQPELGLVARYIPSV